VNPITVTLVKVKKTDPKLRSLMKVHYSQPKGFVGRSVCYLIYCDGVNYGAIVGGSATRFLPNRALIGSLNNGVNNIFFHIEKDGKYPIRNFTTEVIKAYRNSVERDWLEFYGDSVFWHETLVEPPRTGECYKRDGWTLVGVTKGFTCKRVAGVGTDSWSGKRVWNTVNLRPKLVFVRKCHD
jgi:hypothetical protein